MPDSNANTTRDEFIRRAFRMIGKDSPSTNAVAIAVRLLNAVMKKMDREGRWLWTISNTPTPLTLVIGQRTYTVGVAATNLPSNILGIERMELIIGTGYNPLRKLGKNEAISSFEREGTGEPYLFHFAQAPLASANTLQVLPTPSMAYSAQMYVRRRLYDFDNASDNPDMPQEFELDLGDIFTYRLGLEFGMPIDDRQLNKQSHDEALMRIKAYTAATDDPDRTTRKTVYF